MDIYRNEIEREILKASNKSRILFAALTTERLIPNYVFFQKINEWGNVEFLKEGLAIVYQSLIKSNLYSRSEIEEIREVVDSVTPDTEDFSDITTSFALDACTAIYDLLNYLIDNEVDYIINISNYALETVDMFVQEKYGLQPSDEERELKINNDPLLLREKERQKNILKKLNDLNLDVLTDDLIESLRDYTPIIELELLGKAN